MSDKINKSEVMSMLDKSIDSNSLNIGSYTINNNIIDGTMGNSISCWDYWDNYYHPCIYPSYPVYIQERAVDNGKKAFEIVKMLNDKKKLNLKTVKDFIDIMDLLIKVL